MYQRKTKDITISPAFEKILRQISHKSKVAKILLHKISKEDLVADPVDFLSISKTDPSKITYISSARIKKYDPDDFWNCKGREQAKPAIAIKKILKNSTEQDLDLFTTLYKAASLPKNYEFEIITGRENIIKYYDEKSYRKANGKLNNSCMRHDSCANYFEIYNKNPEVCQMLIMLDSDGFLLSRALLWNAVDEEGN